MVQAGDRQLSDRRTRGLELPFILGERRAEDGRRAFKVKPAEGRVDRLSPAPAQLHRAGPPCDSVPEVREEGDDRDPELVRIAGLSEALGRDAQEVALTRDGQPEVAPRGHLERAQGPSTIPAARGERGLDQVAEKCLRGDRITLQAQGRLAGHERQAPAPPATRAEINREDPWRRERRRDDGRGLFRAREQGHFGRSVELRQPALEGDHADPPGEVAVVQEKLSEVLGRGGLDRGAQVREEDRLVDDDGPTRVVHEAHLDMGRMPHELDPVGVA